MEILIWIGLLIVYSIVQSLKNKNQPAKKRAPLPEGESRPATLQDALREIQQALQEARQSAEPPPAQTVESRRASTSQLPRLASPPRTEQPVREPEFHSMERQIPDRQLESKTDYRRKVYTQTNLERSKTYEDSFPKRSFYDDKYSHPHMEAGEGTQKTVEKKPDAPADVLRKRLQDKQYLSEAFIIQEILGEPLSKRRLR